MTTFSGPFYNNRPTWGYPNVPRSREPYAPFSHGMNDRVCILFVLTFVTYRIDKVEL